MKALRIGLLGLLLVVTGSVARATTVTGTVTDPGSNPYAGGTLFATLSDTAGVTPTVAGASVATLGFTLTSAGRWVYGPVTLNSSGVLSTTLPAASTISPASTTYTFTVCANSVNLGPAVPQVPVCYSTTTGVTIAGMSQSISTELSAVAPRLGPNAVAGGISSLNALTAATQLFAIDTTGTDFTIGSAVATHTLHMPTSSAANRGLLSAADWSTFNGKSSISGLSTSNCIPVATSATTIGCSTITDDGMHGGFSITVGGGIVQSGSATFYVGNGAAAQGTVLYCGGTPGSAACDVAIGPVATFTQNTLVTTLAGNLVQASTTVGALPAAAAGNKYTIRSVSDSTAVAAEGQTCVGGSTNAAMAYSNGVVWKCF